MTKKKVEGDVTILGAVTYNSPIHEVMMMIESKSGYDGLYMQLEWRKVL
jgi:hypothetical protein